MLTGYIRGQELRISTPEIAADSIKYLEAEFHFAGRDWDGYVKTAYFINGANKFALVLADDRITADMGLNLTAGEWEVKLSGVKGDSRITTTTERIYVREFGGTEGTLPDVTPTQAEQLLAKIGNMSALETEAKDSLVAAINEAAQTGGGGTGMSAAQITALDNLFKIAVYKEDSSHAYAAFRAAFGLPSATSVFVADFSGNKPSANQFYSWDGRVYGNAIYDKLANIQCVNGVAKLKSVYDSENSRWVKQMMCTGGLFESDNFTCMFKAKFCGKPGSWNNVITYGTGTHWTNGMYSDGVKWPSGGEIDSFEQAGGYAETPNYMTTPTAHWGSGSGSGYPDTHLSRKSERVTFTTDEWHDFKFSLKDGVVKVYIDRELVGENDFSDCVVSNNYLVNYKPFLKPQAFYIDGSCADGSDTSNEYTFEVSDFTIEQESLVECAGLKIYPQMWDPDTHLVFPVGAEIYFDRKYTPINVSNKACFWESSNNEVATVVQGFVKTLKVGTTTIKAKCGDVTAIYVLTVADNKSAEIPCAKVEASKQSVISAVGQKVSLEIYKYPTFTTEDISVVSNNENICKVTGTVVTMVGVGEAMVTIHCGRASFDVLFTVKAAKTPYIAYDFTPLKSNVGTEKTDEKMTVAITNTGSAGSALDLTASAQTSDVIVDNKWQTQILAYSARNASLVDKLNLTAQSFLYIVDNLKEGAAITINGTNANVMPSVATNVSKHELYIRYGSVDFLTVSLTENPTNKVAVYYDGEKTSVFVNGKKVLSDGGKDYIATAVEYFNFKNAHCLDGFKFFLGDNFEDYEITELTQ